MVLGVGVLKRHVIAVVLLPQIVTVAAAVIAVVVVLEVATRKPSCRKGYVILRWRLFQDGGQSPSWILSNWKWRHSIRRPRKPLPRTTDGVDRMHRLLDIRL